MQTQCGRGEPLSSATAIRAPKAASPLQGEIDQLHCLLDKQTALIKGLHERLSPLMLETPVNVATQPPSELPALSQMPSQVRDCRIHLENNMQQLDYILSRLEV